MTFYAFKIFFALFNSITSQEIENYEKFDTFLSAL